LFYIKTTKRRHLYVEWRAKRHIFYCYLRHFIFYKSNAACKNAHYYWYCSYV